jgi:GT2 family glycosyltransferase
MGSPPCHLHGKGNRYENIEAPFFSAIVQSFKDPPMQALQLTTRLRSIPLPKEIIVNDDSHGKHGETWRRLLTRPNEFYISSPGLHEVFAYNRLAMMARGLLLVFVQGDCCLPATSVWMQDAARIFEKLPRLAMLSGRAGFDIALNYQMSSRFRNQRTWGDVPYKPLRHVLPVDAEGESPIPLEFVPGVDNGPLIYRREALLDVGGFDESYACAVGHVAVHYDFEVALRFWTLDWQVGVYYGGAANGLGGRKSLRHQNAKRERHTNELYNARRVERLWEKYNATVLSNIAKSTWQHLREMPVEARNVTRSNSRFRVGQRPKDRCYEGIRSSELNREIRGRARARHK